MKNKQWKKMVILVTLCLGITLLVHMLPTGHDTPKQKDKQEIIADSIEKIDYDFTYDFNTNTLTEIIDTLLDNYSVNEHNLSYFYYSTLTDETIIQSGEEPMNAASTIKVPLNMLYYDMIQNQEITSDDTLNYCYACYEDGGIVGSSYSMGSSIPLTTLLYESIVNSDNTATNILVNNLGFHEFRESIFAYSKHSYAQEYYENNYTNATYAYDIIKYLYDNQNNYTELIEEMKEAKPNQYLQASSDRFAIAHKYGEYEGFLHDYGIVYTPYPYLIGIFSEGISNSELLIEDLNTIFLEYTLWNQNNYK